MSTGGSGGNRGGGAPDAAALAGQEGGDASGTKPCQGLEIPDFDCNPGTPTYICVKGENGWAWDFTCAPKSGGEAGLPYPIDAPDERTCTVDGKTYAFWVTWTKDCNTCWCNASFPNGTCTMESCSVDAGPPSSGEAGGKSPIDAHVEGGQGGSTERTCTYKGETYPYGVTWKDDDNICSCDAVGGGGGLYGTCVKASSGDGGPSLGCDTVAAARAALATGIVPLGFGTISSATLPSDLASDPNWGVKDTECREGGYALSPVAGKMVCLVSFDTTEKCQQLPAQVWVVMSEGKVHGIYKSAALNPGIYSVHDPLCNSPDASGCPLTNPATWPCRNSISTCIPVGCACADDGQWRCTSECRGGRGCIDGGTD
jgi:hypothetical protein